MSDIFQPLPGFRFAETQFGDTLQAIAFRELGDAAGWAALASINNLIPPYITDDSDLVSDRVRLTGSMILVPATSSVANAQTNPDLVFGNDCALKNGMLTATNGDLTVCSGRANLRQALANAVQTDPGDLMFHADYGCKIRRVLGAIAGPAAALLAAEYVKTTLLADDRVTEVTQATASVVGDSIPISVEVIPISGRPINLSMNS